jgi:hypothetical protein
MAVQITAVIPTLPSSTNLQGLSEDQIIDKHLAMRAFNWINPTSQNSGQTNRDLMYDFIVNKGGKVYIITKEGQIIYVFGAVSKDGQKYVRAAKDKKWNEELINIQIEKSKSTLEATGAME